MIRELTAGTLDFAVTISTFSAPFSVEGKIKPIGVTGPSRLSSLPDVPTVSDSGIKELRSLGSYVWFGLVGPANMPASVTQTLNEAMNKVARMPDFIQRLEKLNFRPATGTSADFRQLVESELTRWREVGKTIKVANN